MNRPTIWTIGHSTMPIEQLIGDLQREKIELLIDVRRLPGSRRHPWFGAERLAASLREAGLSYLGMGESLGGRRSRGPEGSPNAAWTNAAFRAYADWMLSDEFAKGVDELKAAAASRRSAVMCSEAVWWRCHRRLIADRLVVDGWVVLHIVGGQVSEHKLTPWARVEEDGRLSYPAPQTQLASDV